MNGHKPCKVCGNSSRTQCGRCIPCRDAYNARYRAEHSERLKEAMRRYNRTAAIRVDRVCRVCGGPFKAFPHVVARGHGLYCSVECQHASMRGPRGLAGIPMSPAGLCAAIEASHGAR